MQTIQTITPEQFAALESRVALLERLITAESRVKELEDAARVSLEISPDDSPITAVTKIVAKFSKTPLEMFTREERLPEIYCTPRQIAMYLCIERRLGSSKVIGSAFGGRNYGTVLHAHSKIKNLPPTDPYYRLYTLCKKEVERLDLKRAP